MILRAFVAGLVLPSLFGCGTNTSSPTSTVAAVATVGGEPISAALFNVYVEKRTGVTPDKVDSRLKKGLLDELIALKAAGAAGARLGKPSVEQEAELARLEVLARAAADTSGVYAAPSDAELQTAYLGYVASLPAKESHVAHVLVATEPLALGVIRDLDHGGDFAALAKTRSADDSNVRGGDLGWVSPGHLPKEFMDAAAALKPGEYTKQPVRTLYGWHVIRLIETRAANAPPFNQVKAQIAVNLQKDRYDQFLKSVVSRTLIERLQSATPAK